MTASGCADLDLVFAVGKRSRRFRLLDFTREYDPVLSTEIELWRTDTGLAAALGTENSGTETSVTLPTRRLFWGAPLKAESDRTWPTTSARGPASGSVAGVYALRSICRSADIGRIRPVEASGT